MLLRRSILATLTLAAALQPAADAIPDVERAIAAAGTQVASSTEVFPLSGRRQLESCHFQTESGIKSGSYCTHNCNLARSYADCIHGTFCSDDCSGRSSSTGNSCEQTCEDAATEVGYPAENLPWPLPDIVECSCDLQCGTRYSGCVDAEGTAGGP